MTVPTPAWCERPNGHPCPMWDTCLASCPPPDATAADLAAYRERLAHGGDAPTD